MMARLWDARTAQPLGPPFLHDGHVSAVAFSPDGRSIVTGCGDYTARLWRLPVELPEDIERLAVWIETLTGLDMDQQGSVRELDNAAWLERRERLKQLGGPP
jgi:WD40 repeat protein